MHGHVAAFVVADFMRQYGHDFIVAVAGEQCVIKSDATRFAKAGKEGIALGGTSGAVDNADFMHREVELL